MSSILDQDYDRRAACVELVINLLTRAVGYGILLQDPRVTFATLLAQRIVLTSDAFHVGMWIWGEDDFAEELESAADAALVRLHRHAPVAEPSPGKPSASP